MSASGNIALLLRLEYLRWRRGAQFSRDNISRLLSLALWIVTAIAVRDFLGATGTKAAEHLPALLLTDLLLRLVSQQTPPMQRYGTALIRIRRWQSITVYLLTMTLTPVTLVWIPAVMPQWWLMGLFVLDGYVYLALWHTYRHITERGTGRLGVLQARMTGRGLFACEMKMRLRHAGLRTRIFNGLLASMLLTAVSIYIDNVAYTDFTVLYALTFTSLPLLSAGLGYEQDYMPLLTTRLHGLGQVYRAKYLASLLMMLPGILLMMLPLTCGTLSLYRLAGWTLLTAIALYPALLKFAPQTRPNSPTAQIITLTVLALPPLLAHVCTSLIL